MTSTTIYRSHAPEIDLGESAGLFTYTFSNKSFDPNATACIDAVSGEQYTRQELHDLGLRFAFGVKQRGVKRGDIAMIFRYVTRAFCPSLPL